jgi:hypothetical protein
MFSSPAVTPQVSPGGFLDDAAQKKRKLDDLTGGAESHSSSVSPSPFANRTPLPSGPSPVIPRFTPINRTGAGDDGDSTLEDELAVQLGQDLGKSSAQVHRIGFDSSRNFPDNCRWFCSCCRSRKLSWPPSYPYKHRGCP